VYEGVVEKQRAEMLEVGEGCGETRRVHGRRGGLPSRRTTILEGAPLRAPRWVGVFGVAAGLVWPTISVAGDAQPSAPPELPAGAGELFETGRALWEQLAPDELKEQYGFPSLDDAQKFLAALEADMADGSVEKLAAYEPDARRALALLRHLEGGEPLADWLEPRLALLSAAVEIQTTPPPPVVRTAPTRPDAKPDPGVAERVVANARAGRRPQYTRTYWERSVKIRPPPGRNWCRG
jgi:hypothetical protein